MSKKEIDLMGSWVFDENVSGVEDEFLDNVIKHVDFPLEDVEGSTSLEDWDASFQLLELPSSDILEGLPSNFGGKIFDNDSESPLSPSKYDEKPKLTGLPSSGQTASNGSTRRHRAYFSSNTNPFCSSSSVSVLESSGSCSLENSGGPKVGSNSTLDPSSVRKCTHCEVTTTPQWREGPLGPKTLCNACGVRYRSGRLFPEYRPAASPTFTAALHSNSHKRVVEMRKKANLEVRIASGESLRLNQHRNLNRLLHSGELICLCREGVCQ
ncbi:hypothetical protein MLD38_004027 [Melastoma candidum]|uniref:Uncharacterized protein n=1 Tax=Melastoma candidum TaxID=119954 RepID=A0ACB9S894_9MYRT|nr:hypothetical protein MLD38_004027 [Melastoma candidum]